MSFVLTRKLISGENEVKKLIDLASQGGYGIIELIWSKFRGWNAKVIGFELPVDNTKRDRANLNSNEVDLTVDVKCVVGTTNFYLDDSGRCWGYVIDTEYNRNQLAKSFKTNWYKIVDNKVREEVLELAKTKGLSTEAVKKVNYTQRVSKQEQALQEQLLDAQKQLQELAKREAELQKRLEVANGERKPLEGVKINKPKD